jgi:putative oxygen-independent coproporphyrinogen III oxidase
MSIFPGALDKNRKCPYCDFNSHEARDSIGRCRSDFNSHEALRGRAAGRSGAGSCPECGDAASIALFIGGGTPSLFSAEALERLLSGLRARLPLRPDLEITLEANPGTVERGKFAEFREIGINRLSIGVQSFDDDTCTRLGRIHDRRDAIAAAEAAHAAGLDNFNLDLMFGLPGQTVERALSRHRLCAGAATGASFVLPAHHRTEHGFSPVAARSCRTTRSIDVIQRAPRRNWRGTGYRRYEVSAYARENRRCRHNLNYWEFGDYLGIGAGAHGKLTDPAAGKFSVYWKLKHPRDYLARAGTPAGVGGDQPIARSRSAARVSDECLALGRRGAGRAVRRAHRFAAGRAGTRLEPGADAGIVGKRSRAPASRASWGCGF